MLSQIPNLQYVAAWAVGPLAAFGVVAACCARSKTFGAAPGYAATCLVHGVYIVAICYYSLVGPLGWLWEQPATLQERMYGFDPSAEKICLLQMALQLYAIATALLTRHPLLLTPVALTHHVLTGLSMCAAMHPFGHTRVNVFFGITELSTIPLEVIDLFKGFKELRKQCPKLDLACKASFALLFFSLRIGLVTHASVGFQRDLYELYATGTAHSLVVVALSSLFNALICALQFYWSTLIVAGMRRALGGGGGGKGGRSE